MPNSAYVIAQWVADFDIRAVKIQWLATGGPLQTAVVTGDDAVLPCFCVTCVGMRRS